MVVFVNGLQRVGTNYVDTLLKRNTNFMVLEYHNEYWKHDFRGKPKYGGDGRVLCDKVFTVVKNPYTWVESICFRNPVDIVKWFPQYNLRDENDYLGEYKINLKRLVTLYKDWYNSWIGGDNVVLIQYENMLDKRWVKKLLFETDNSIGDIKIDIPDKVAYSNNFERNQIEEYKQYKTRYLNQEHINIISGVLGEKFVNTLGYKLK